MLENISTKINQAEAERIETPPKGLPLSPDLDKNTTCKEEKAMTVRPDLRDDEQGRVIPQSSAESKNKGLNCIPLYTYPYSGAGAASERLSQKRLTELRKTLSERDKKILSALRHCRYMLTSQVQRLYFTNMVSPIACLRTARRILSKLKDLGLISTLTRRVGGVRAGSSSLIWYLTSAGERLLRLGDDGAHTRKRFMEPSIQFLAHTLAVAECYVRLTEICHQGENLKLHAVEMETDCWRAYSRNGKQTTLRPDLFAVTHCDKYEDRWFIEVDLNTEAPPTVVEKCRRYHEYYRSGIEQEKHKVFPLTVWIVPDAARRDSLVSHIRAEFAGQPRLFAVITPDEFEPLIQQGVEKGVLC